MEPAEKERGASAWPDGRTPGVCIVGLLACFSGCVLWASDGYLARKGPPALRFEPPRSAKADFAWPVPLSRTNSSGALSASFPPVSQPSTNSSTQTSTSPAPLTDASTAESLGPVLPTAIGPGFEPFGAETNAFSASNLLNITPQMLADYFKATLDNSYRVSTNVMNGAEIPFNPPLPFAKPSPSSEATYRVQ